MSATYNHLPTELTTNIFTYLRHERRQPPHAAAMNELKKYITRNVTNGAIDIEIWLPYGEMRTTYGESGYALDGAETGGGWESLNGANPYLAERLFVNIIKSLFNITTRARMIMAYGDWRAAAFDPDSDIDIDMAQAPVNINYD